MPRALPCYGFAHLPCQPDHTSSVPRHQTWHLLSRQMTHQHRHVTCHATHHVSMCHELDRVSMFVNIVTSSIRDSVMRSFHDTSAMSASHVYDHVSRSNGRLLRVTYQALTNKQTRMRTPPNPEMPCQQWVMTLQSPLGDVWNAADGIP